MEKRGAWYSNKWTLVFAIILVVAIIVALYFTFFYASSCASFECFQEAMKKCSKVTYVNEEPEASWGYKITGKSGGQCFIKVTLLQAKQGELGIDKLNGYGMECAYPTGISTYPEKDLTRCSGKLREELQTIVINKLHSYLLSNLGQLNESIRSLRVF